VISVDEALERILGNAGPLGTESVSVRRCTGRIPSGDLRAKRTQPPHDVSAMDGYAVKGDEALMYNELAVIGEAPAGRPFPGRVGTGQCVRIFTGGILPDGTDHVIIQEDTERHENRLTITARQSPPEHIRKTGIDFRTGDILVGADTQLTAVQAGLLAAAGLSEIQVICRPKVAVFANGDELSEVENPSATGTISSTPVTLCQWVQDWGGEPDYMGISRDNLQSLADVIEQAGKADIIVPLGGASVGDHDCVKTAFEQAGYGNVFSKIAIKPGKPAWFGYLNGTPILGLPGNPASGLVCAQVFLKPLIKKLGGQQADPLPFDHIPAARDIDPNGSRAVFHRGFTNEAGQAVLHPEQDSSLLGTFAKSDILVFQPGEHSGYAARDLVPVLRLG